MLLPIPPLEEQKRIVKILDEKCAQLETIKANAQTNLQNAKDLFQSQLTKAFNNSTWEKKKLETIAKINDIKQELKTARLIEPKYMKRCHKCSVYDVCNPRNRIIKKYMKDIKERYYETS